MFVVDCILGASPQTPWVGFAEFRVKTSELAYYPHTGKRVIWLDQVFSLEESD
jgi:hypothetical protein